MIEVRELTKDYGDKRFRGDVFVRSPRRSGLTRVLTGMGATVLAEPDGGLSVTGMDAWRIASAAAARHIPIQELTPRRPSLEDSYLELMKRQRGVPRAPPGRGSRPMSTDVFFSEWQKVRDMSW